MKIGHNYVAILIGVDKEPQVSNLFVSPLGADRPCDTDLFVCPENTDVLWHFYRTELLIIQLKTGKKYIADPCLSKKHWRTP